MEFNTPLIGSRDNNYRFFYCTGGATILSLFLLFIITSYTAYVSTHIGHLMTDMTEVLDDVNIILPDIEKALHVLEHLCLNSNFTKYYGDICK